MKLLLKAALRSRKHLSLLIVHIRDPQSPLLWPARWKCSPFGVLSNNGADFFALFSTEKPVDAPRDAVSLQTVQAKWPEIDKEGTGVITKAQAAAYVADCRKRLIL